MQKRALFISTLFLLLCYKSSTLFAASLPDYQWHTFIGGEGGQVLVSKKDIFGNIILAGVSVKAFLGENNAPPVTPFLGSNSQTVFVMKLNAQLKAVIYGTHF